MATSITDNGDMVDLEILPDVEIERLTTERVRNETPPWKSRHESAWTKVLHHLAMRPTPIEETDLTDTDELKRATCYMVAYFAYLAGEHEEDHKKAERFLSMSIKELEEITLNDGDLDRGCYAYSRSYRA